MPVVLLETTEVDPTTIYVFMGVIGFVCLLLLVSFFRYGSIWARALSAGAYVSLFDILFMPVRRISPRLVVDTYIRLKHGGVEATTVDLQKHVLAGGDVKRVADWLVAARGSGVAADLGKAARLDLAKELRDLADVPTHDRKAIFQRMVRG